MTAGPSRSVNALIPRDPRRREWIALGALVGLALLIRVVFFHGGVRGADAYAYAQHAYNIATGQYDVRGGPHYGGFRYAVLLPTALAYRAFGIGDWPSALFPLVASLGALVLVVRLGVAWFDGGTGLMAGLLYTVFPLDVIHATLLGPSSLVPLLSGAAILAFWRSGQGDGPASRAGWSLVSGVCVGLATQAREVGLLLLAPIVLMALRRHGRRGLADLGAVGLGVAIPLLFEGLYYWQATGDPMYRITVVGKLSEWLAGGADPEAVVGWAYYPRAMLGLDLGGLAHFGFFGYLALLAILFAAWRNEGRRLAPVLAWFIPVFGYLEFGSMSPTRYLPIIKAYEYLSLISVPLVLLGAYGCAGMLARAPGARGDGRDGRWRAVVVGLGLAGLAATALYGVYRVRENTRNDSRPYLVVAQAVQASPERPIYVAAYRWALFLNYHLGYRTGFNFFSVPPGGRGRIRYVWEAPEASALPEAYVALHDRYLYYDTKGRFVGWAPGLPAYAFGPPAAWRVVVREHGTPAYNAFALYETDS